MTGAQDSRQTAVGTQKETGLLPARGVDGIRGGLTPEEASQRDLEMQVHWARVGLR